MNGSDIAALALAAEAGRLEEAERGVTAVIAREPRHVEALALAAWIAHARGDDETCEQRLAQVFALDPSHRAATTIALSLANRRGDRDAAVAHARRLATASPDDVVAQHNLGVTLAYHGDERGARAALAHALALSPSYVPTLLSRAELELAAGAFDAALADLERARAAAPHDASVEVALGVVALRRYDGVAARPHFERAIALEPRHASAWRGLSQALELAGVDHRAAIDASAHSVALARDDAHAWFEHAKCLSRQGFVAEARAAAVHALERAPAWLAPRWLLFQSLPYPHESEQSIVSARAIWHAGLAVFDSLPVESDAVRAELPALLTLQPNFHRHYLGDDLTKDQRAYGALVTRYAHAAFPPRTLPPPRRGAKRRRIGFASAHLRRHTIWKLFHQWLARLDRERYEVVAVYVGATVDDTVRGLSSIADEVVGPYHDDATWVDALNRAKLDALVWLDIGMDGATQLLAPQRYAPLQCATWGHPITTGLASIDAFLSGDAMEPAQAQSHYSERLVRLPQLGIAYAPPEAAEYRRRAPDRAAVRYACVQSVYKLLPAHDEAFARILAATPGATLDLTPHPVPEVRDRLAARMRPVFARHGVDFDARVRLRGYLPESGFLALLRDTDVLLDSFGWSGGNTTLEALAYDLPVVTLPGAFMRARHTHGIVSVLGLADSLSAKNTDDYVAIATRLGTDAAFHAEISAAMSERKASLYAGNDAIAALERFLDLRLS